jgi:hypothetical protein
MWSNSDELVLHVGDWGQQALLGACYKVGFGVWFVWGAVGHAVIFWHVGRLFLASCSSLCEVVSLEGEECLSF